MTQLKVNDLVERQDRLDVMMEALMGKIDKMSIDIISKHDIPSGKGKEVKRSTWWALSSSDENIAENSNVDEKDDVVNHGRKFCTYQNLLYETWLGREFGGRVRPNRDLSQ